MGDRTLSERVMELEGKVLELGKERGYHAGAILGLLERVERLEGRRVVVRKVKGPVKRKKAE